MRPNKKLSQEAGNDQELEICDHGTIFARTLSRKRLHPLCIFFLESLSFFRYNKTEEGEIVALGAYRVREGSVAVYIAYIESQPESNPTLTKQKKYRGIGKAMIAFGIQLSIDANCNGVVVFEAKTDELEQHYIRDFGARPVASLYPDGPKTFMIADQAAKDIFSSYLF